MIRKQNSLIGDSFSGLDRGSNKPHIPLNQSLLQNKALTLFNSIKVEEGEEAESLKLAEVGS